MSVRETRSIQIDYHPVSGRKMLNRYEIYGELGRGQHGKVKLGRDTANNQYVAIKTVDRKDRPRLGRPSTSTAETKVRQEIAILKKCNHRNVVRLLEVLDDSTSRKIYLVLEYLEHGEVKWQNADQTPSLSRERARQVFLDTLMGLEYLHSHGIIHRDIKPANLLLSKDNTVKISDFGVSYAFTSQDCDELEMAKTVGSPAFFAPEMCLFDESETRPRITGKIDVWALGVTLYCLLYGNLPFDGENEYELFRVISKCKLEIPETNDADLAQANDLIRKMLTKDPAQRIDIAEIRKHPWLLQCPPPAQPKSVEVSDEDVDHAVRGIASRIRDSFSRLLSRSRSRGRSEVGSPPTGELAAMRISRKEQHRQNSQEREPFKPESLTSRARRAPSVPSAPDSVGTPASGSTVTTVDTLQSEPASHSATASDLPSLPLAAHAMSEPASRVQLPTQVFTPPERKYPSEDTLNMPHYNNSDSESDSESDGGHLTLAFGRKR